MSFAEIFGTTTWIPDVETPCYSQPDAWSDSRKYRGSPEMTRLAKKICIDECPVTEECLESALREESGLMKRDRYGIRGGLTPRERDKLMKSRLTKNDEENESGIEGN